MIIILVNSSQSFSQTQKSHTISQGLGTSGSITSYKQQLNSKFSVGASFSKLLINPTIPLKIAGQEVRVSLQTFMLQGSAFVRFHPFGKKDTSGYSHNNFFISAGYAKKKSSFYELSFSSRDPLQIGQFNLTREQTGSVNIDVVTHTTLPFVSMGYEKKINKTRLSIIAEVGFYNHGIPQISMSSTGVFRLNDRNKDQIQKNISSLKYYPLLNLSVGYKLQNTKPSLKTKK